LKRRDFTNNRHLVSKAGMDVQMGKSHTIRLV